MSASIEFPFPTIIKNLDTPVDDSDSATKGYVDGEVAAALAGGTPEDFVLKTGDTMDGPLILSADPIIENLQAATKDYVDAEIANAVIDAGAGGIASAVSFQALGNITSSNVQGAIVELDELTVKSAGDTMTGQLVMEIEPTIANHVTTKNYVDTQLTTRLANKLNISGGTMTGPLILSASTNAISPALAPTTKDYVTLLQSYKLNISGGTMTGDLTLDADPTLPLHAATKNYVDDQDDLKLSLSGGTMTGNLAVEGNLIIDVDNTKITGGVEGQVLTVNSVGDLIWAYPGAYPVDFVQASRTINSPNIGASTAVVLNRVVSGSGRLRDDYNTTNGTFVLRANQTYSVVFNPYWGQFSDKNNGYISYEVVYAANSTPIMSNFSGYGIALPVTWNNTSTASNGDKSLINFIIKPTVDITAKISTGTAIGTASLSSQGTLLTINRLSMLSDGSSGGGASSAAVAKVGDTMTGPLILSGAPTDDLQATTKQYVDTVAAVTPLDYVKVAFSVDYTISTTANTAIPFNKILTQNGDIDYNTVTGAFVLRAGKTYRLQAIIGGNGTTSTSHLAFQWRNTANAAIGGTSTGVSCSMGTRGDAVNPMADAIYTPVSDENVFLKVTSSQGGAIIAKPDTGTGWSTAWATIIQLR